MLPIIFLWVLALFLVFLCVFAVVTMVTTVKTNVPFVPSSYKIINKMIELAAIAPGENIADIGCGNGKVLFLAEKVLLQKESLKTNTTAPKVPIKILGFELNLFLVLWARSIAFFRKSKVQFVQTDFFQEDFSEFDVVFCYLWPSIMDRFFEEKFSTLKKGTRIISNTFQFKNYTPSKTIKLKKSSLYLYIV